jgi:hypothetical protein
MGAGEILAIDEQDDRDNDKVSGAANVLRQISFSIFQFSI